MKSSSFLIISNSYFARNILYGLSSALRTPLGSVYLLEENHSLSENYFGLPVELISNDNIAACIPNCDYILIHGHEIDYPLLDVSLIENKTVIRFPKIVDNNSDINALYQSGSELVPKILNICIGKYSCPFCTEMLLNEVFQKHSNSFKQIFSQTSLSIINTLREHKLLSDRVYDCLSKEGLYDIEICSIYLDDPIELQINDDLFSAIKSLSPKYVMLTTTLDKLASNKDLDNVKNTFLYRHNANLNSVVFSNYFESPSKQCGIYYEASNSMDSLYSECHFFSQSIKQIIENDILKHIAYPNKMRLL